MSDLEAQIQEACEVGDWTRAATVAIEGYGPEVLTYLRALARDESDAADVFSTFCEQLWSSLAKFRWESSVRTWSYALARHAWSHQVRDRARRPQIALSEAPSRELATKVRTTTALHLRSDLKDRLADMRATLDDDERTLLILRVDRGMAWRDVARVMGDEADAAPTIDRRAAALRQRFATLKNRLREKLRAD